MTLDERAKGKLWLSIMLIIMIKIIHVDSEPTNKRYTADPNTDLYCSEQRNVIKCQMCCGKMGRLGDVIDFKCRCYYYAPIDYSATSVEPAGEQADENKQEMIEEGGLVDKAAYDKHLAEQRLNWVLLE